MAGRVFLAQITLNALPLVLPQRALPPLARKGELRLRFVAELAALRTAAALTSPAATVGRHLEINATLRVGPSPPRPTGRPYTNAELAKRLAKETVART